ncbi:similar to Saccharomyces cerevisiae YHR022C Putative protein of unknown function [Maudiozyma saulgeensis]|uniref:Uncharacterized protein n=1 Tax=Maudiozyma saulgeensis TaxID=1789683 RepID=A0A1X7R569_9SACH|nr:similar to Saccharomyces cerevisiae YHR022C Putative protein of unknown function [Kazachstania saulgeensis]
MSGLLIYDAQPNQIPRCFDTNTVRIMVMGDNLSGKTSFILRCLNGTYREIESGLYMEDIYRRPLNLLSLFNDNKLINDHDISEFINNKNFNKKFLPKEVQFLDTSPFEIADFSELRNQQIIQSDAFILCFDPTSVESLLNLRTYQRRIERVRGIDDMVPIMIAATKSDLMSERKVFNDDILEMMNRFELSYTSNFIEISSKHDINIKKLFVKTIIKSQQYKSKQRNLLNSMEDSLIQRQNFPESISDINELSSSSDVGLVGPTNHEHITGNNNNNNKDNIILTTPVSNINNDDMIEPVNSKVRLIDIKGQNDGNNIRSESTNNKNILNKIKTNSSRSIVIREKTAALDYKSDKDQLEKKRHSKSDSCCVIS